MKEETRLKRKVRQSYAVSTISIALVLFLLGSVGYMIVTAMEASTQLRNSISATVELEASVGVEQRDLIKSEIERLDFAGEISFLSKESKIEDSEFRELFGDDFMEVLTSNPLNDSYEVALEIDDRGAEALMEEFMAAIASIEGVASVHYPVQLADKVEATMSKILMVLFAFGGALLVISLILLNNTIRLAIYSRRYVINTMKLVGATKWFIMRPLVWSGVKCGLWAGVAASILFLGSVYAMGRAVPELFTMAQVELLAAIVGSIILMGVVISLIFTIFAVNKFVNMKSNKIHLY